MAEIDLIFMNTENTSEADIDIDDSWTADQTIEALINVGFLEPLPDPMRFYYMTVKNSGTMIPPGGTFASVRVRTGDRIRIEVFETGGGGWVEILTVAASIGSIAQVALMVADMWSRRPKKQTTGKANQSASKSISKDWDHISWIYVEMIDGTRVSFDSWYDDPEKIKSFVQVFNSSSSSSSKPLWVAFVFKDHTAIRVDASDGAANKQQLEQLINYLKL